jgi:hypothetical protein
VGQYTVSIVRITEIHKYTVRAEWFHGLIGDQNKVKKIKVKVPRYRPGVAQRVPGGLGSQIFMTFGTRRW